MMIMERCNQLQWAKGFVMVELLLSIAVVTVVVTGAIMMLFSTISATRAEHDTRQSMVRRQVIVTRMGATLRGSSMLLGEGGNHFVLWTGDSDDSGQPNLSELLRIEWVEDEQMVRAYEADAGLPPNLDTEYEFTDNFSSITDAIAGSASFPGRTELRDVTSFELNLDEADIQSARVVELEITVQSLSGIDTSIIVARLRADYP